MRPDVMRLLAGLALGAVSWPGAASFAQPGPDGETDKELPVQELCEGRFMIRGKVDPALSETEKKLVCGSKEDSRAWAEIPFPQARFNLTNFLQERGYHKPVFRIDTPPGPEARFTVLPGEPTIVSSLSARGAPDGLDLRRKRKVVGEILAPKLLGTVEQWVFQRMQAMGYPCPKVTSEADPVTGAVVVHVEPGPLQDLVSIIEEPVPGGEAGILRRYDAFRLGERFNADLLTVTENRISFQRILQNAYFTTACTDRGATARQEVTAGPPRFLTFGAGFNTEGLFLGRASWRNSRVGNRLSLVDLTLQGSTKEQRLTFFSNWYAFPWTSRRFWQPTVEVRHQNENAFEVLATTAKLLASTTWDNQWLGVEAGIGPSFEAYRTLRGSGQLDPNSFFASLELGLRARTHYFEYWQANPRTGASVQFTTNLASRDALSTASAQRFRFDGQALLNFRNYDPPLLILGVRGGYRITLSPERPGPGTRLPAAYFHYLGGSLDLRGFDRRSVPPLGAMTAAFVSPEARLSTVLPLNVEPLVFVDIGAVGTKPWTIDFPALFSPGFGLRWKSPVGTLRTTLAHGIPVEPAGGWTFYFSFGEEF